MAFIQFATPTSVGRHNLKDGTRHAAGRLPACYKPLSIKGRQGRFDTHQVPVCPRLNGMMTMPRKHNGVPPMPC